MVFFRKLADLRRSLGKNGGWDGNVGGGYNGEYGIKLALNIISAHFGNLVTKVCECLLHKGTLTLPEIIRFTDLPSQQAKNCLLVLIQHNCVQLSHSSNQDDQGEISKSAKYVVVSYNILHRMRFTKFLGVVLDEFDEECVEIVEDLLQHGRLSFEQIVSRAIAKRNEGDRDVQEAIQENFEKLVNAHYVERCPGSESVFMPQEDDNRSSTRMRGPKSTKIVETETVEQQIITDGISSERFVVERNTYTDISEATTFGKHTDVTVGEKRKIEALKTDDGTKVVLSEKEVLWRANFEEFVSHLRSKACVASVRTRYDDGAGIVLNVMLQATRKAQRTKTERSVPLSKDDILNKVMEIEECCSMTLEDIVAVLSQLYCHCVTVGGKESYCVDLKDIIETAQNDEVESLVLKRFGKDAYKMFRLLSLSARVMETNKISDDAFVEKKEALKLLFHLWKDNYLHMEKVTAHGSAQRQFLLWKINNCSVRERAFDEMCHAALNLRLRLAYEVEQEREILQLPQDEVGGAQGKKFKRIEKVKEVLEASLMKLDDDIMLFHDF